MFGGLIMAKIYVDKHPNIKKVLLLSGKNANTDSLVKKIMADSLYTVKDVAYKDSAVMISISNPDKTGTETYFDKKYKLNSFDNINMVCVYLYDSTKPLLRFSIGDAIMAKGKRLGRFQDIWVAQFVDTTDGSCIPLKKYLRSSMKNPASFKNELTTYQPENIYKMRVLCKYTYRDSLWQKSVDNITALVDTGGNILSVEKIIE